MDCPFCGTRLHDGSVRVAGWRTSRAEESLVWEPIDDTTEKRRTLSLGRDRRLAGFCAGCGAVIVAPFSAELPNERTGLRRLVFGR